MEDVQNIGGTPGLIKFLIDNDMFDGNQMTVTGKTHSENLAEMGHIGLTPGQEIIRPLSDPVKPTGHLQIMYGNLCPGGGVAKITGKEGRAFTVRVFYFLSTRRFSLLLRISSIPPRHPFPSFDRIISLFPPSLPQGTARVYDNEQLMLRGLERKEIKCGDIIIIRYEGPTGEPGLPEMLTPTR